MAISAVESAYIRRDFMTPRSSYQQSPYLLYRRATRKVGFYSAKYIADEYRMAAYDAAAPPMTGVMITTLSAISLQQPHAVSRHAQHRSHCTAVPEQVLMIPAR